MASEHEWRLRTVARDRLTDVRRHRLTGLVVNLAPSGFWLTVFFLVPLAVMFFYSFGSRGAFGEVLLEPEYLGLQQYRTFFIPRDATVLQAVWVTIAFVIERVIPWEVGLTTQQPTPYVRLTIRSIEFGFTATIVALVVGYPVAYYIGAIAPKRYRYMLLFLIVLPFWASYLVRVYAIQILLSSNSLLTTPLGMIVPWLEPGQSLMNTSFAVMTGMVYIWIPFMILPVYASIEQIDFTLQEAAMDLGADRFEAFYRVILPLSMPGVAAGSILVFIPSVGAFVIPELLGGTGSQMIGNFIANQFGAAGNWPLGAAAAFILMGIMLVTIAVYQRFVGGELV